MSIYEPNDEVRDTGEEAGEFVEPAGAGVRFPTPSEEEGEQSGEDIADPSDAKLTTSEPLEDEDGNTYVIRQQNVGSGNEAGGGEWPDPHAPPQSPAPGSAPPR